MKIFKSFLILYLNMRAVSYVCSCMCMRDTSIYESEHVHMCRSEVNFECHLRCLSPQMSFEIGLFIDLTNYAALAGQSASKSTCPRPSSAGIRMCHPARLLTWVLRGLWEFELNKWMKFCVVKIHYILEISLVYLAFWVHLFTCALFYLFIFYLL